MLYKAYMCMHMSYKYLLPYIYLSTCVCITLPVLLCCILHWQQWWKDELELERNKNSSEYANGFIGLRKCTPVKTKHLDDQNNASSDLIDGANTEDESKVTTSSLCTHMRHKNT
jgi:hypothetical protein